MHKGILNILQYTIMADAFDLCVILHVLFCSPKQSCTASCRSPLESGITIVRVVVVVAVAITVTITAVFIYYPHGIHNASQLNEDL